MKLFSLFVISSAIVACGGGSSSAPSNSVPDQVQTPAPVSTPAPTSTPTPDSVATAIPVGEDFFNGEPIVEIIADGNASHPFWAEYWEYNVMFGSFFDSQRELDEQWESFERIPFKPQEALCKADYVSPFELSEQRATITLVGDTVIDLPVGSVFVEPGFSAQDIDSTDITSSVIVEFPDKIDFQEVGNYLITYHVTGQSGLAALTRSRLLRVYTDEPEIESLVLHSESVSPLNHYAFVPDNYAVDESQTYPTIIYFHGWGQSEDFGPPGERLAGGAAEAVRRVGTQLWDQGPDFLVFYPQRTQVLRDNIFTASVNDPTMRNPCEMREFIDYVIQNYRIDTNRIYFVGFSNGVMAVTEYLRSFNDRPAAAILMAGGAWLQPICDFSHIPALGFSR